MAEVTEKDRDQTGFKGDKSFPMNTGAQVRSAIMLRGHSKHGHSSSAVLDKAEAAVSRLLKQGKIGESEAANLRKRIALARKADSGKKGE